MTWGSEAANVRRATIQVVDRQRFNRPGRYLVRVWVWSGEFTGSGGAQTLSVATGTLQAAVTANECVDVITTGAGTAAVDVTIVGAANRTAHAVVIDEIQTSTAAWV